MKICFNHLIFDDVESGTAGSMLLNSVFNKHHFPIQHATISERPQRRACFQAMVVVNSTKKRRISNVAEQQLSIILSVTCY